MRRGFFNIIAFAILTLLFAPAKGNAQDISGYPLGYCNGEFLPTAIVKFNGSDVLVSGAIYITPSYAATVTGNELTTVRVGIGSTRNVSDVSVWVREELDGADLAHGGPEASFVQGWNEIDLDTPLAITPELASKGFYIGYSFMQSFKSAGLAALSTPSEGGMWVKCGDDAWENRSSEGTLCLEGLVYGSSLPRLNVKVEGVTVDKWYIVDQGLLNGVITVRNLATETVSSLTIEGKIEGIDSPCSTVVSCDIPYDEVMKVPFVVYPGYVSDEQREISGTFTITAINGEADEDASDNSASTKFNVIMKAYPRKVMIEEFTTLDCSNCPRMAGYLHDMMEDPTYSKVVEIVCHHTGFGTDEFTLPGDTDYNWFYNAGGSTYAPAIMMDRAYSKFPETPVFLPSSVSETEEYVEKRLAEPSVVSLNIMAERDGLALNVTVTGDVIEMDALCENPYITVYLVEDNIITDYQAGAGPGYVLQHTTRAVNATWGEPLVINSDNTYSYSCSLPYYDKYYKYEDMSVVAMIGNLNLNNPMDCVVENSASITLEEAAGVGPAVSEQNAETLIYTIQGIRVKNIQTPGLYIVNGKKVMVK